MAVHLAVDDHLLRECFSHLFGTRRKALATRASVSHGGNSCNKIFEESALKVAANLPSGEKEIKKIVAQAAWHVGFGRPGGLPHAVLQQALATPPILCP